MDRRVAAAARSGRLVVFAGAGVSAGEPSSLPSWFALNELIAEVLLARSDVVFEGYLSADHVQPAFDSIGAARELQRFPFEYQAQLIEEMSGPKYFEALTSVDIEEYNEAHEGIAALAAAGCLAAIVTTNFDRLIERALEAHGVAYATAIDDASYAMAAGRLQDGADEPLIILKVHGSVSDPSSLVDTLKQRRLGRGVALDRCMDLLGPFYVVYVGFSASDLNGDPDYLRLVPNAARSDGATYVVWPGAVTDDGPSLGEGARFLLNAYGERGSVVIGEAGAFLGEVLAQVGRQLPDRAMVGGPRSTTAAVRSRLEEWCADLTPGAVGLCLSSLLEAAGEGETAARVLDRLVRKVMTTTQAREDPYYQPAQLHYGRLGAAWGRYVNVPDMFGAPSNASVESLQSLLRLTGTDLEVAALGWIALGFLWLGDGENALKTTDRLARMAENWEIQQTPEGWADSSIAAAQVLMVDATGHMFDRIAESALWARDRAIESGDVVRAARAGSLYLLAKAETSDDLPAAVAEFDDSPDGEFGEARRVGDGFSLGFREMAMGRWMIAASGGDVAENGIGEPAEVAIEAAEHLDAASQWMSRQVMDPWQVFISLQRVRVWADLRRWDDVEGELVRAYRGVERFPIWQSSFHEIKSEVDRMVGDSRGALEQLTRAIDAAGASGLMNRREMLAAFRDEAFS